MTTPDPSQPSQPATAPATRAAATQLAAALYIAHVVGWQRSPWASTPGHTTQPPSGTSQLADHQAVIRVRGLYISARDYRAALLDLSGDARDAVAAHYQRQMRTSTPPTPTRAALAAFAVLAAVLGV